MKHHSQKITPARQLAPLNMAKMETTPNPPASFTYHPSLEGFNISPQAYLAANPSLTDLVVSAVLLDTPLNQKSAGTPVTNPPRTLLIQRAATDGYALYWECPGGGVELGPSPSHAAKQDDPPINMNIATEPSSEPSKYWEGPVQQGHLHSAGDTTILTALAREVFEETGLRMTHVEALIDDTCEFGNKKGTIRAQKFTFLVDFERGNCEGEELGGVGMGMGIGTIKLNPAEHQDFMWATEEDVVKGEELASQPGVDGKGARRRIVFAFDDQQERLIEGFRILNDSLGK